MSWQATAWAINQTTGSTRRKAVLMALAHYADANGDCWPSQERLARDTEQSVDSVQRHCKALEKDGRLRRELMPKRRGHYPSYRYRLLLTPIGSPDAVLVGHSDLRCGPTAKTTGAPPHSLRPKPSRETSYEHSASKPSAEQRLRAFQAKQEPTEMIQNRIAQRIGEDGWVVLGDISDNQRSYLTKLERQGKLTDEQLSDVVYEARLRALQ
jgi:hypothetical protein